MVVSPKVYRLLAYSPFPRSSTRNLAPVGRLALIAANSRETLRQWPYSCRGKGSPFIMILRRSSSPRSRLIPEDPPSPSPRTPSLYAVVSNFMAAALRIYVPLVPALLSPRVYARRRCFIVRRKSPREIRVDTSREWTRYMWARTTVSETHIR